MLEHPFYRLQRYARPPVQPHIREICPAFAALVSLRRAASAIDDGDITPRLTPNTVRQSRQTATPRDDNPRIATR